jgi:radical SAM superfamily enzyme YgiQ (UPF0313 family)
LTYKKSPSILLVYPSSFNYVEALERLDIKTSQLWLASYLNRSYPVAYADFEIEIGRPCTPVQIKRFERRARKYLAEQAFDILAISCWASLSYRAAMSVARICRELYPDKVIVVGGYHATARPQEFITDEHLFDYIITREGEIALKEIADGFYQTGRPPEPQIVIGPTVANEDIVDYDWDLMESFRSRTAQQPDATGYIYLSRGCPFGCSFCMEPAKDRSWRAYSPEKAVQVLFDFQERFNLFSIGVSDACFGMRRSWRKKFFEILARRKPDFWLVFETRPEYLDSEDIKLLDGLKLELQFGIESGSPEMLLIMKKTRQPEKFLDRFADLSLELSEHKILHRANMIFNHPGETRKTLRETYAYVDRLLERNDSYLMWANAQYMHFPGCELDTNRSYYEEKYGSRFIGGDWWKREDGDLRQISMDFVPSRDLEGDGVGLWERMMMERDGRMRDTLAPLAFRFAAIKYFLDWQDDVRYQHS